MLLGHGCSLGGGLRNLGDESYDAERGAHKHMGVAVGKGGISAGGRAAAPNTQGRGRRRARIVQGRKATGY